MCLCPLVQSHEEFHEDIESVLLNEFLRPELLELLLLALLHSQLLVLEYNWVPQLSHYLLRLVWSQEVFDLLDLLYCSLNIVAIIIASTDVGRLRTNEGNLNLWRFRDVIGRWEWDSSSTLRSHSLDISHAGLVFLLNSLIAVSLRNTRVFLYWLSSLGVVVLDLGWADSLILINERVDYLELIENFKDR